MIVTVTANPSVDRTVELPGPLTRGEVLRARSVRSQPGGKGINVARAIAEAGLPTLALLPAAPGDRLLKQLDSAGLPYRSVVIDDDVRVNLTLAEPDGTTTKINEAGAELSPTALAHLTDLIVDCSAGASWVVLSGSLPPGVPADWYVGVTVRLHAAGLKVAVDTSGSPLLAIPGVRPDLLKPNAFELAELTGGDGAMLEAAADAGDLAPAATAAASLAERTGGTVLTTLGGAGALLTVGADTWFATPPPVRVRSTVGAGDASLAGYLIAQQRGSAPAKCLRTAVAYGSAAAALPGTTPPTPKQLDLAGVAVRQLS
ncbi:putative 1-phosphofructokinase [Gordonia hirsuta DSM 44140 = NBRC 16056]|uniref:Putative 1-phosphofructokinase n=1 Tax=Gordonia hirsuta DSM 44140 = NBRC 16056 TaxID=1121927 RepID=L7LB01_9ACTN|nr:1-phosphofructokinase family hexose kinase [Gordonia hirsuta]GAC58315.1 putative 1-phosphofructokinase [Gordonia hirsuta DSM 44140 = NBRC 16056]